MPEPGTDMNGALAPATIAHAQPTSVLGEFNTAFAAALGITDVAHRSALDELSRRTRRAALHGRAYDAGGRRSPPARRLMRLRIHRGAREIGGSCVELEQDGREVVLDLGLPLESAPTLPDVGGLAQEEPRPKGAETRPKTGKARSDSGN